jgi:PAS domain S-box-containing protein
LVAASDPPVLLLDSEFVIMAASASFCRTFGLDPVQVPGKQIAQLGSGEWTSRQLRYLLKSTLAGVVELDAYEMDLRVEGRAPRLLVLKARRLEYGDEDHQRLLLTITDVTEAKARERQKDDLVREKAILLQELQHRVANSLQIIASVLMQNARKVASEETRGHLYEAHNRIMSVATIQRHLVASRIGDVALRPYFTDLCQSISASMIGDHERLSLEVTVDDSSISADESVSMGLIVTELVINALKHAFPGHRSGRILVEFRSAGDGWLLSVSDDGIGVPEGAFEAKPGLGTGIVEAISKQLHASVCVTDTAPGTTISVTRASTN